MMVTSREGIVLLTLAIWVKTIACITVLAAVLSVAVSHFHFVPGGHEAENGVKAATSAFGAATMVFVGMIRTGRAGRWVDLSTRVLSGVFALMAGTFWVLSETNGDKWPYMIAVGPIGVVLFVGLLFSVLVTIMSQGSTDNESRSSLRVRPARPSGRKLSVSN